MNLHSPDAQLSLSILGYQFPLMTEDCFDIDWLMIDGRASHQGRTWMFTDPCLLTYEVAILADYLEAVALGSPTSPFLVFTEPNLQFELPQDGILRVLFELEARPPWRPPRFTDDDVFAIDFAVNSEELRRAASELRVQLGKFPRRSTRRGSHAA